VSQSRSHNHSESNSASLKKLDPGQVLQGIQILLVEDEPDIAALLNLILKEAGAAEALTRLEAHAPHVLLCNVLLPDRNGDWLIEQIRQQEAQTGQFLPALAVTFYTRECSSQCLLSKGFQAYLDKFFAPERLVLEVLNLANAHQQH